MSEYSRRVDGETLYGINTFADYESGKYGDFLRYGIGGELQSPYAALAVNYYLPITDDKHNGAQVAFSQKGYDANLRINIPRLDFLKLRADYYLFDGKYGGEDDKGFRYGLELQPINNLRIGVFYRWQHKRRKVANGDFLRYGIGGELKSLCGIGSKLLLADTDDKHWRTRHSPQTCGLTFRVWIF